MWMDVRQKTIYPDVTSYSGGGSQPASQLHIYPDVTSYLDVTSDPDVTSYSGGGSQLHTPVAAVSQPGCTQDVFLIRQQSHVMMTTSPDESSESNYLLLSFYAVILRWATFCHISKTRPFILLYLTLSQLQ